jgi:hypothetical protein
MTALLTYLMENWDGWHLKMQVEITTAQKVFGIDKV